MANHPEQAETDNQFLYEQIAATRVALLHAFLDDVLEMPPEKPQSEPESTDPDQGLQGEYGVNVD